jgi:hypothetical protein
MIRKDVPDFASLHPGYAGFHTDVVLAKARDIGDRGDSG